MVGNEKEEFIVESRKVESRKVESRKQIMTSVVAVATVIVSAVLAFGALNPVLRSKADAPVADFAIPASTDP